MCLSESVINALFLTGTIKSHMEKDSLEQGSGSTVPHLGFPEPLGPQPGVSRVLVGGSVTRNACKHPLWRVPYCQHLDPKAAGC